MLLPLIRISSQSQPRTAPGGPINPSAHLWVPRGSRGNTATQLHHYRWLQPKRSGYRSSAAVRCGSAATAQTPTAAGHREKREHNRSPKGHQEEQWGFGTTVGPTGWPYPRPVPRHQPRGVRNLSRNTRLGVRNQRAMPPSLVPSPPSWGHAQTALLFKGKVKLRFSP